MMVSPVLAVSFFMNFIAVLFVICAVALILIILIQKGRGGGLGATFGGGLASGILGSKTGDFLTWVTIATVGVFLMLAVIMAKFYKPSISNFGADQPLPTQQLPAQQPRTQQEPLQRSELPTIPDETAGENPDANPLDANLVEHY